MIGPFLAKTSGSAHAVSQVAARRKCLPLENCICPPDAIHTVKPLEVDIPKGRLTVVTGVSGSGKTTMVLESLIPGLEASAERRASAGTCESRFRQRGSPM